MTDKNKKEKTVTAPEKITIQDQWDKLVKEADELIKTPITAESKANMLDILQEMGELMDLELVDYRDWNDSGCSCG